MSDEPTTRPTLDTLLEMMREVRDEVHSGFQAVNERLDRIENRLSRVERKVGLLNQDIL
jgi:hypothetical protein